jgi:hypothetical protein
MPAVDFLPRKLYNAFSRMGVGSDPLKGLLALQGNPEYVSFWDDFIGTRGGTWPASTPYAATNGTGTEVIGITQARGGTMTLTTGANADDSAGQGIGLNWSGDDGFYFIARVKLDVITNAKFEVGLTDAITSRDTGAINNKATPTFTATDCAIVCLDTTEDAALTFLSNGGTTDANADWSGTLVADAYLIIEIVGGGPTTAAGASTTGDNVAAYINGQLVGSGNINGATALSPWVYCETNTTAVRILTVDYWGIIGPRAGAWGGAV